MKKFICPLILIVAITHIACNSEPPENPPLNSINWIEYTHPQLGYFIRYPDNYSIHENDSDVLFRLDGYPVVVINYVTRQEARDRGLWIKHKPVESLSVDNIHWQKFVYNHYDGPFGMRTVTYATTFREKWLGLEFRTSGELDEVHMEIMNSLKFPGLLMDR